jgi:hypothetical protein
MRVDILVRVTRMLQLAAAACALALVSSAASAQISVVAVSAPDPGSNNVSSVTVPLPTGVTAGDLLLAVIAFRGGDQSAIASTPAGWTQVTSTVDGALLGMSVFRKLATAVEPASYTWTFSASNRAAAAIMAFRGVDASSSIDAFATRVNGPSTSLTAPSITPDVPNTMLVAFWGATNGNATVTPPPAMAPSFVLANTTAGPNGLVLGGATEAHSAAAATGTRVATAGSAVPNTGYLLALRPGPSANPAPGGFNAFETSTPAGAIAGVIKTRIAGTAFALAAVATNPARTAVLTTFTGTVTVALLNASDNTGALDATTQCRSTWTSVIATVSPSPSFAVADSGRINVSFPAVANAYRDVRVRVTYTSGATTVIGCSTDDFAIRPSSFTSVLATDGTDTTTGVTRTLNNTSTTTGVVHRAGRAFTVIGTAVASTGTTTTGYDGTPTLDVTSCSVPAGCAAGTLTSSLAASSGSISGTASYTEAGVITATLTDTTFAAVDAADSTTAERYVTGSAITVGRFVPEAYRLTASVTPTLAPPLCGGGPSSQSFVFVGQNFSFGTTPAVLATPINFAGTVLANARPRFGTNAVTTTLSATGAPVALTGSVSASAVTTSSTASIAFTGTSLGFTRGATPVASFTPTIAMTVDVSDTTETATAGNTAINDEATLTVSPVAFSPAASPFYYGRIQLYPTFGDYRRDLSVPLEVQAWNGLGWTPLTAAAACVAAGATTFAYSLPTGGLDNGAGAFNCGTRVAATVTTSNGRAGIALASPAYTSTTQPSAMTLMLNLLAVASGQSCSALNTTTAATTTALTWLSWPNGSNPSARVTWGRARGDAIYLKERFD